jgi:hypothetical protein
MLNKSSNNQRILAISFFAFIHFLLNDAIFAQNSSDFEKSEINGWSIYSSKEFLGSSTQSAVLTILHEKFEEISSNISPQSLTIMRTIPIWIYPDAKGKDLNPFDYHPSSEWLASHNLKTEWAGAIVIANASEFLIEINKHPGIIASLMADGFDHRKFTYQVPDFGQLFRKLRTNTEFNKIMEREGIRDTQSIDQRRLFSFLSTIYISRADEFPFTRNDLKIVNEDAFKSMENIWGRKN